MKERIKNWQPILTLVLTALTIICLVPLLLVVVVSFSSEESILRNGFTLFPSGWSLEGWKYVTEYSGQIARAYTVTLYEVIVGTLITLLLTSMFAYGLSRKDWVLSPILSIFLLITMLFHGGLVSNYIIYGSVYNLKENLLVLVLPGAVSAYNCLIMRTYIQSNIPNSLIESAKIDGAGEMYLFFRVILPLMKPTLAAIGFMSAVGHWNEWQTSMLYISDPNKATLQLLLVRIENSIDYLMNNVDNLTAVEMEMLKNAPSESMRMAILCVTMGPILIAYPFFQKYFVKGITVGAVKG